MDFCNFTALCTIECFYCTSLTSIKLQNVSVLTGLCLENYKISDLDLSEAPSLADFRGASQGSLTYAENWGNTGANLWHVCVRDNPQITRILPASQFPIIKDFYVWNSNQSENLNLNSTNLKSVLASNNYYNTANFSGCFPAGRRGTVIINNNELTRLDISNDPGLLYLNVSSNSLNQTGIDQLLQTLDSYKTRNGTLDLTGNSAPSSIGIAHVNNLTDRGWKVQS